MSVVRAIRIARYLGPWADEALMPPGIQEVDEELDGRLRMRWYLPKKRARGMMFIMPGVHFAGPDDPRLRRFASIMASAGRAVVVPFLPDYLRLQPTPEVFADAATFVDAALESEHRPDHQKALLFSISFGSLPALYVAAGSRADEFAAVVTFGGYGVWDSTVRFALTGDETVPHPDPLNHPVVVLNLCHHIPDMADDADTLRNYWRRFCMRTWGDEAMKLPENFGPVADELAQELPAGLRERFLIGCGARPGGVERCLQALEDGDWSYLDPTPHIRALKIPLRVIHGVSDDVIPHSQAEAIADASPAAARVRVYKTGLFSHTGAESAGPSLADQVREYRTMVGMLFALAG